MELSCYRTVFMGCVQLLLEALLQVEIAEMSRQSFWTS